MTAKLVYLVRHGEAEHNVMPRPDTFKGESALLTKLGHEQAKKIAERAEKLPIECLITSEMPRAMQTAGYIQERRKIPSVLTSKLFVEVRSPSSLEGRLFNDPEAQDIHQRWEESMFRHTKVLDGENYPEALERGFLALRNLERLDAKHVMVVTHGLFKRFLVGIVMLGDCVNADALRSMLYTMWTKNTGITVLEYDPDNQFAKWRLVTWNDHAHLADD